jgi:Tol biopolymer transport system component
VDGLTPVPEDEWISIADVAGDDYAQWSPDGRTLYFSSGRDGYNCLWGQRLNPESHRPTGEAFAVQPLHGRLSFEHRGWSTAGGRIALALVETTGNVWMMSPARER